LKVGRQKDEHDWDEDEDEDDRKRSTNYTVERGAGFGRLVPGGPSGGRKFSDSIDRKIG
jgi:hypothetical protein